LWGAKRRAVDKIYRRKGCFERIFGLIRGIGEIGEKHMANARPRAWIAWSSGKDSAWSLHVARQKREVEVVGMLTTVTAAYDRVSMHAVRNVLVDMQAKEAGLPLYRAPIPAKCTNEDYEAVMKRAMDEAKAAGITTIVFGDLFLEEIRNYRIAQLAKAGMTANFPLWLEDTTALARTMMSGGLKAYLTCIDPRKMPRELAGHPFDEDLLAKLPSGVDPCGENGEFHSFAYAGPMFKRPIAVTVGETVEREGFVFTDVLPA
jgi:uncharacterized protein (TIGR00290 family)